MATSVFVNGTRQNIPGVFSSIKSGIQNQAQALAFGNLLVIDVGGGVNYGGGAGINGTLASGKDAVYTFTDLQSFRDFVGGGLWWLLGNPLFNPGGGATNGVSSLTYVRAKTTSPASLTIHFGQGSSPADDGSVTIQCRYEGLCGNGSVASTGVLTRGFGATVIPGILDPTKFIVQFWRGTFKGYDTAVSTGDPYDFIAELSITAPQLIVQSPELNTVTALVAWMNDVNNTGYLFNQFFKLQSSTIGNPDHIVNPLDLTNGTYDLFAGGTESFNSTNLSAALDALADQNWDFILADDFNANALSTSNQSIQAWINGTLKIKPDLYVAAGKTQGQFATSQTVAATYNSQYVTVVHGGAKVAAPGGRALKEYDSIYHAAVLLGREAGLEPQVPLTFKGLGIQGESHQLNNKEASLALDKGLLVSKLDNGSFDVVKGVNSLQLNQFLINSDGTTASKQLSRIIRALNKSIVVNAKAVLLKKPDGANRKTVSPEDVVSFMQGLLNSFVATDTNDNLILSFGNITVKVNQDRYDVTYSFTPNFELSFIVAVGLVIDPNT